MNTKDALYTGSFDPITRGHLDVIRRASQVFQRVYVGVANSATKKHLFTQDERTNLLTELKQGDNVHIIQIPPDRLTVDIAYEMQAVLIKGVRMNAADFDYEWLLKDIGLAHQQGVDTFILPAQDEFNKISSSAAKEICKLNGHTEKFVPLRVKAEMEKRLVKQVRFSVTGTIGCGKSTVTKEILKVCESRGQQAHDIDIDAIAGDVMFKREEPAYVALREELQDLLEISSWNRTEIGRVIFNQEDKRIALNKRLISPLMTRVRAVLQGKEGFIIVNCALLAESGLLPLVNNNVVLLDVGENEQRVRLKARGYEEDQIARRVSSQMSTSQKMETINRAIATEDYGSRTAHRTDLNKTPEQIAVSIVDDFMRFL